MLDITDITHQPDMGEICGYIGGSLFDTFYNHMMDEYKALYKIEFSKDTYAYGWNVKFRKAGKSLCVVYPKDHYFTVLVVVGPKEKERVESLLPQFCEQTRQIYHQTKEGNGQRWLMIDVRAIDAVYQDIVKLIRIRRESK